MTHVRARLEPFSASSGVSVCTYCSIKGSQERRTEDGDRDLLQQSALLVHAHGMYTDTSA